MATPKRLADDLLAVAAKLSAAGPKSGFFPLVAFLERLMAAKAPLGGEGPAFEEGVRFRHDPAMTFSAGDVTKVELKENVARPGDPTSPRQPVFEVTTTFLGLTGSVTPLPFFVAEEVAQEVAQAQDGVSQAVRRDFLDVFHHRLLSLIYRVRPRYDLAAGFRSGAEDRWSRRLLSLAGVTGDEKLERVPAWRLLRLAPLLAARARTTQGLAVFVADVLEDDLRGAGVEVKEFGGAWADLAVAQRMRLGKANHELGRTTVLGGRVFFRGGSFVIRMGPLDERTYRRLLPDGDLLPAVREAVELYLPDPLDFTLELVLGREVATGFRLSRSSPARLGRDTWLASSKGTQKELRVSA